MPAQLRLGQKLFYSANSDDVPLTQNHWVACATCHLEGRSDAVTWHFAQGPRDTPSNAGGLLDTGFLFRTADRTQVQDYWKTINVEQGGHFQHHRTVAAAAAGRAGRLRELRHPGADPAVARREPRAVGIGARGAARAGRGGVRAARLRQLPQRPGLHRLGRRQPVARPQRSGGLDTGRGRRAAARRRHLRHRRHDARRRARGHSRATRATPAPSIRPSCAV